MDDKDQEGRAGLKPGEKENLLSLVGYQQGSVVSRAIINKGTGTVTLFAFDEGERLSEHTSPYDALMYVLEGAALVTIDGKETEVREGEIVILPAGRPHSLSATTKLKMLLTMIRQ